MDKKKKPNFLMVGLGSALITLGLLVVFFVISDSLKASSQTCTNSACFVSAANSCADATLTSEEPIGTVKHSTSGCYYLKTIVKANSSEVPEVKSLVEGKSLMCKYDPGNFNMNWISYISEDIEYCQGPLKEAIGELIVFSESAAK